MEIPYKGALKQLGLTDSEAKVYVTLLKIGPSIVSDIAKNSGLYRPYVYDNLKRLQEKGLVSFILKEGRKQFKASHPSCLVEFEEERLSAVNKLVPKLEGFFKEPKEETKVDLYSGNKVVRIVQKDVLKTLLEKRGESLVLGVDEKRF